MYFVEESSTSFSLNKNFNVSASEPSSLLIRIIGRALRPEFPRGLPVIIYQLF